MKTKKQPTEVETIKAAMIDIEKKIVKIRKAVESRIDYEETKSGTVNDTTMDRADFVARIENLLKNFSHLYKY